MVPVFPLLISAFVGFHALQGGTAAATAAALPNVRLDYSFPVVSGRSIRVRDGDKLQSALNNARRGDEIVLASGATFTGNFELPEKKGTAADGWIVVRSEALDQLPRQGTRVTAAHANLMATIVTPNTDPALKTKGATSGWWLAGIEITVASSVTRQQYGIVALGDGGPPQTTLADVAQDLVLDRVYIHGQPTTNTSRCLALNSGRTQLTDSYLAECHGKDFDSQAICGWNGPGPYKIVNNRLEGAGENIMFGGTSVALTGNVPSDIEIRRNHIITPLSWKGRWQKKNLLELKNAARVLIEGNVLEGSWTDGQTGWAIIVRDDGCSHCFSRDVTIQRNLIRKAGAGIGVGAPLRRGTARITITENVLDTLGVAPYTGDQRGFQQFAPVTHVTLERNLLSGGSISAAFYAEGGAPCVVRDNVWQAGEYGLIASGFPSGQPTWGAFCGKNRSSVWSNMTLIGQSHGNPYPAGTRWIQSERAGSPMAQRIRKLVSDATAGVADR